MKIVVGLGNPGSQYARTRHNLGFMVIDELARRWDVDLTTEKFHAWFGLTQVGDQKIALAKPITFVNRSGKAVLNLVQFYKIELVELLIVTDDLALPIGKLRMRASGSPGGHNGLADINQSLGTQEYSRLRVGIGSPRFDMVDHVLGEFGEDEMIDVNQAVHRSADAVVCWIENGTVTTMNRFNVDTNN